MLSSETKNICIFQFLILLIFFVETKHWNIHTPEMFQQFLSFILEFSIFQPTTIYSPTNNNGNNEAKSIVMSPTNNNVNKAKVFELSQPTIIISSKQRVLEIYILQPTIMSTEQFLQQIWLESKHLLWSTTSLLQSGMK